jgi:hypothetical protein
MIRGVLLGLTMLQPVPVTGPVTDIGSHIIWVEDHHSNLSVTDFLDIVRQNKFKDAGGKFINLGFNENPIYFAAKINNTTSYNNFVLNLDYSAIDDVTLYIAKNGKILSPQKGGDKYHFSARYFPHRTPNFQLRLNANEEAILIGRIESKGSIQLPLKLFTESAFYNYAANDSLGYGSFYGLILVMIAYNGFLYFSLKLPSYLSYIGYLFFILLFHASLKGSLAQFVFLDQSNLIGKPFMLWNTLSFVCGLLFTRQFLELDSRQPKLARAMKIFTMASIIYALSSLILSYEINARMTALWSVTTPALFIFAGFSSLYYGFRPARYFVLAFLVFMLGVACYGFKAFGLLPSHYIFDYAIIIGLSIKICLLSLALADRVNLIQKERDDANREVIESYKKLSHEIHRREALARQNNELAKEIDLTTLQLSQASKLATLGQQVAGVAHDIASPTQSIKISTIDARKTLKAIKMRLDQLIGEPQDSESRQITQDFTKDIQQASSSLDEMEAALERIRSIHSAIRNQARLDSAMTSVSIKQLIDECIIILKSKIEPWSIQINCPDDLIIVCRRSQFGQVVTNLLSNAADALALRRSHPNPKEIHSRLIIRVYDGASNTGERNIIMEVEDDGPGIEANRTQDIFKPFFTTKDLVSGTGLGLSITKKIVDDHEGILTVIPAKELSGACFRVELKCKEQFSVGPNEHDPLSSSEGTSNVG